MPQRREQPYIWATSLPKLITGECSCEYAAWFKAHHQGWTRQPSDFDAVQWQIQHTALLTETRDRFLASGYDVFTEAQNARLQGKAGRPARSPCRPRRRRPHHRRQDRPGTPVPHRPAHALHVRPAQGAAAVPRSPDPRRGLLPHPYPPSRPRKPRPGFHTTPGSPHPAHRGSRAPSDRCQRVRVPFLRHHGRRLPGPRGRRCCARRRRNRGLLTSSCSTSAVPVDSLSQSSCNIL